MLSDKKPVLDHTQESPPTSLQISTKRPHFRYVDYDRLSRVKQIRVKFWKFHSCNLSNFTAEIEYSKTRTLENIRKENEKKEEFEKTLNHLTIKRGFKFVKSVNWSCRLLSKNKLFPELCKLFRLETLTITIVPDNKPYKLLTALFNSKLKDCFLIFGSVRTPCDLDPMLISSFRRLNRSHLYIINNSENLKMLLGTGSIRLCRPSSHFTPRMQKTGFEFISNRVIINSPKSFQKISYQCLNHMLPDLPPLPNLKDLRFAVQSDERLVDISFVEHCSKLESLSMQFVSCHPENLDNLTSLPHLKEFSFSLKQAQVEKAFTLTLPHLTKLAKFGLSLNESTIFSTENIRDFISKNKNLQTLDLTLSIQNIGAILNKHDTNLSLTQIKILRLNFLPCEDPDVEAANLIIEALKRSDCIEQLSLEFQQTSAELNKTLFKEGLVFLKSLENLTLKYHTLRKFEKNNFGNLKDAFAALGSLKVLSLDFGPEALGPQEFSSILDALCQLKHLEKFRFRAKVIQFTATAYKQLLNFLNSIRHVRGLDFSLQGISPIDGNRLRKNLLSKFVLSLPSFSFALWLDT